MPLTFTWDIDPIMLHLGDFMSLRYYSLFFAGGIYLAGMMLQRHHNQTGEKDFPFDSLAIYLIIGIVVGARLGHCLFYDPMYYLAHPVEMLSPVQYIDGSWTVTGFLGLASHGGILGMIIAIYLFHRKSKINFLSLLDKIALVAPITGVMIRTGNFFNSEIIGNATGGDWGVIFSRVDLIPRHPSQLYEALAYLAIFLFIYKKRTSWLPTPGKLFGYTIALVFVARFIIEFTKIDQVSFEAGMVLNMGQLLSIPLVIVGLIVAFKSGKVSD